MAAQGGQQVAGRLGPGGAKTKGHQSPRLQYPEQGWTEPLGEGGRSGRQRRIRHLPSGPDHPGQAVELVTRARRTKKRRGEGRWGGAAKERGDAAGEEGKRR